MKRSFFIAILALFLPVFSIAQEPGRPPDLKKITDRVMAEKTSEGERVRAIYEWITDNITYMLRPPRSLPGSVTFSDTDDSGRLKTLDQRVAESVVAHGTGVCDDYARLFRHMCNLAGIEAELVHGFAKGRRSLFSTNHTWNAVRIDGEWKLLDVTWASGYISFSGRHFIQERDDAWYLPEPRYFIKTHFPDDPKWTLLDEVPPIDEFNRSPFRQRSFSKYGIRSFFPSKGVIETSPGERIEFTLALKDLKKDQQVGADPFLDTSQYRRGDWVLLYPRITSRDIARYELNYADPAIRWVFLMYNDDIVLRYYVRPR